MSAAGISAAWTADRIALRGTPRPYQHFRGASYIWVGNLVSGRAAGVGCGRCT